MSMYELACPCCGANITAQVTDSEKIRTAGHSEDCSCFRDEVNHVVLELHRNVQSQPPPPRNVRHRRSG